MTKSELCQYIHNRKWEKVLQRISSHPEEVRSSENKCLPIHYACEVQGVPLDVIEALIQSYPQALRDKNNPLSLSPLHFAVNPIESSATVTVTQMLLKHYKKGAAMRDKYGKIPLSAHLLTCATPSLEITKLLVDAQPDTVRMSDKNNRYPLHYAAYCGSWEISHYLIGLYPEALLRKDSNDKIPQDVAYNNKQFLLCAKLHEEEETHFGSSRHRSKSISRSEDIEPMGHEQDDKNKTLINVDGSISKYQLQTQDSDCISVDGKPKNDGSKTNLQKEIQTGNSRSLPVENENVQSVTVGTLNAFSNDMDHARAGILSDQPPKHDNHFTKRSMTKIKQANKKTKNTSSRNKKLDKVSEDCTLQKVESTEIISSIDNEHTPTHNVISSSDDLKLNQSITSYSSKKTFMGRFQEKLNEVESFWNVTPLPTQNLVYRITALEQKVFNETKQGGLEHRISSLIYVDGTDNGTWEDWISGFENLILGDVHQDTVNERIACLEEIVKGKINDGCMYDRLVDLDNSM